MIYYSNKQKLNQEHLLGVEHRLEHICFISNNIIYLLLYIPPNVPNKDIKCGFDQIIENLDRLQTKNPRCSFCILGDFNQAPTHILTDGLHLKNIVMDNTRNNAKLDLVLVSKNLCSKFNTTVKAPLANSDHNSVYVYPDANTAFNYQKRKFLDLRKSNIDSFCDSLSTVNWNHMYSIKNVNNKCEFFQSSLQSLLKLLPTYTVTTSSRDKEWITPLCKHLINLRWKSFHEKDYVKYKHYQEKVKSEIVKSKALWADKCKRSPSGLWQFVKKSNPSSRRNILSLKHDNEDLECFLDRVNNELAQSFSSNDAPSLCISEQQQDAYFNVTELEVFEKLESINTHKSSGNDNLPNILLKKASLFLCTPLCHLYNSIIQSSSFPSIWKTSDICALPKTKVADITKLRPISLLPTTSKIFERILLERLQSYILPHIKSDQFGFMKKSSTTSCLIHIQSITTRLLDISTISAVSIISFDLKRAFDTIPHKLLVTKLSQCLPKNLCYLIYDYLTNRHQQVKIESSRSSKLPISSGVPQGAILSPILFNLFINDLTFGSNGYLYKYADDATLVLPHYSNSTSSAAADSINSMVSIMEKWCKNNYLTLNTSKTQIMTVKKNRHFQCDIPSLPQLKILGVIFNKNLKWDNHVNTIVKKASKNIYLIRSLKQYITKKELVIVYKSKILSILNYASELFINLPQHLTHVIDKICKRVHSIVCHPNCKCPLFDMPSSIRLKKSINLYLKAHCDTCHPIHSLIPEKLPKSRKFRQPQSLSERHKRTFIPFITEVINNML